MSIFTRLKEVRLVRVLLVYLGAAWVVVEAADLLQEQLALPDWVVPVTVILLLVGLLVVAATAWVQSRPSTDRREAAGEVPTDWELDLKDLARSVRGGRLPHLTWTRALAGGATAFVTLFVLATWVFPRDEVGSGAVGSADPGLAVLPFRASGAELAPWREGLVDLLSRNLDGLGELRAIDSRTVLARWSEAVEDGADPDLAGALAVAARTGARWALVGSAVEVGPQVRVSADVYEVQTGRRVDGAAAEGSPDSLLTLVDALSVDVARALLEREEPELSRLRLSSITTASPEALRWFLDGEASYRRLAFREAIEAYEQAVELDPAFALAHYRLASARGWVGIGGLAARARAYEYRHRLPDREALMVEADYLARSGALPSGVELLREGVRRYPDDPEIRYQLGDIYVHFGPQLLMTPEEAERALARAVALDPGFAPYHIHLVDYALVEGDSAEAARRLEAEAALAGADSRELRAHRLTFDYLYGSPTARREAMAALDTLPEPVRSWLRIPISLSGERAHGILELANAVCADGMADLPPDPAYMYNCLSTHTAAGRIADVRRFMASLDRRGWALLSASAGIALRQTGADPSAPIHDPDPLLAAPPIPDGVIDPTLFTAGVLAVEHGRTTLVDSIIGVYTDTVSARSARGDTLEARIVRGLAEGLQAFIDLAAGERDGALGHLERSADLLAGSTGPESTFRTAVVWPLAELYAANGREREALPLYASLWQGLYAGPALIRRAELHERLGDDQEARRLRADFLRLWADADPDHPLVRRARSALEPG
jgi:tetratricopeptide (TPR) repeat protein